MKLLSKSLLAAAAFMAALPTANAASITNDTLIINILRDGLSGSSMLIDTKQLASDFGDGTIGTWSPDADLATAISTFLAGSSNVSFWAAGKYAGGAFGFNTIAVSTATLSRDQITAFFSTNFDAYLSNANAGIFSGATIGTTESWVANIPAGDNAHYKETWLLGNGLVAGIPSNPVGGSLFINDFDTLGGSLVVNAIANNWTLSATGTLGYNVPTIPVPAAVWLFGSGLLGLVGVARRRTV